jgi:hypothetical protein
MADDKKVTLDFESSHFYDSWTYEVQGDKYVIENGGTEVPASRADELIAASQQTEAKLRKV